MTGKIAEHYSASDVDIVDLLINSEFVGLKINMLIVSILVYIASGGLY